jgi:anti-anti-sigma factor
MATPLSLGTTQRGDGTPVLHAAGELDLSNIDRFRHALENVLTAPRNTESVIVDFSEIEYLDSGAINTLFSYTPQIHLIVNPVLMSVLTVSGLADEVSVEPADGT